MPPRCPPSPTTFDLLTFLPEVVWPTLEWWYLHSPPWAVGAFRPQLLRIPSSLLPQYIVKCHGSTLLPQFLGMYRVSVDNEDSYMLVMRNMFSHRLPVHRKYDLKVRRGQLGLRERLLLAQEWGRAWEGTYFISKERRLGLSTHLWSWVLTILLATCADLVFGSLHRAP